MTGGYKIDVRVTALDVFRRMGVYDAVVASSTQMQAALLGSADLALLQRNYARAS